MKKPFLFLGVGLALSLGLAHAEIIQMEETPPDDPKPHPRDLTPTVDQGDSLIDVRVPEPADLDVCIYGAGGEVISLEQAHASELSLPTPESGSYTIQVCVDGHAYVGTFDVE